MRKTGLVALLALAGACDHRPLIKPATDAGPSLDGQTTFDRRPRWIAVANRFDLSVVRFDDATAPETKILAWVDYPTGTPPATTPSILLSPLPLDEAVIITDSITWSMEGHHMVFAARQPTSLRLWVASAESGFEPHEIVVGAADHVAARWIGDDDLVVAVSHDDQVDFTRLSAPAWTSEALGSYVSDPKNQASAALNATFNASWAGALYSLGSPAAGELWLVRVKEAPRRVGAAIPQGGRPCEYTLTWSLDGQSAVWWGRSVFDSRSRDDLGCQAAPAVDAVPGASPAIGVEVEPTRFSHSQSEKIGDSQPSDTYSWEVISGAVAGAPVGPAIAHGVCPASWASPSVSSEASVVGTLVVKSTVKGDGALVPHEESDADVCDLQHPRFGFINATDYFFVRRQDIPGSQKHRYDVVINRQGQEHVVSAGLLNVLEAAAFAHGHHLVFAAADASGQGLWSVDVTAPIPTAERVTIDVASNERLAQHLRPLGAIPLLRSSEWLRGFVKGDDPIRGSSDHEALLVGIDDLSGSPCNAYFRGCSRWLVVDFDGGPVVAPLGSEWRESDLTWTPDAQGLFAVGRGGVYWLTGADYQERYRLSEDADAIVVPPRWPAR